MRMQRKASQDVLQENNNSAWQREMIHKKKLNQVETPIFGKVRDRVPEVSQRDSEKNNYLIDEK